MIDTHAHVIYGIDDGARDFEEACAMLEMAAENGTKAIVATSHYIPETYDYSQEQYKERLNILNGYCLKEGLEIKVYPGNELFLSPENIKDLEVGLCNTYNRSDYVLVEMSNFMKKKQAIELLDIISNNGKKIVLAHAERIRYVLDDFSLIEDWYKKGYIFQVNGSSLLKKKYKENYKSAHKLLSKGFIHMLASDGHRLDRRQPVLLEAYHYIEKILGSEAADLLLEKNPSCIIFNKEAVGLRDTLYIKNYRLKRVIAKMKGV